MGVSTSLNILNLFQNPFARHATRNGCFPFRANWLTDEEAVFTADGQIQHLHPPAHQSCRNVSASNPSTAGLYPKEK